MIAYIQKHGIINIILIIASYALIRFSIHYFYFLFLIPQAKCWFPGLEHGSWALITKLWYAPPLSTTCWFQTSQTWKPQTLERNLGMGGNAFFKLSKMRELSNLNESFSIYSLLTFIMNSLFFIKNKSEKMLFFS